MPTPPTLTRHLAAPSGRPRRYAALALLLFVAACGGGGGGGGGETPAPSVPAEPVVPSEPTTPAPDTGPLETALFPFVVANDIAPGPTDLRALSSGPIAADDFVHVQDGHLHTRSGRVRLFGINLTQAAALPEHDEADTLVQRLTKQGINAVRLMSLDAYPAPQGLLKSDLRSFDATSLDRFDYLVSRLKAAGIYIDVPLHTYRQLPGLPTLASLPTGYKGIDMVDRTAIGLQKSYARELLTHVNPYTGLALKDDPVLALVEISNEDGLSFFWGTGALDTLPGSLATSFQSAWTAWLKARYANTAALTAAWAPGSTEPGAELLPEGSFAEGTDGWALEKNNGADASIALSATGPSGETAATITVARAGVNSYDLLFKNQVALEAGRIYQVTFLARNNAPGDNTRSQRVINLSLSQNRSPWRTYYVNGYVALSNVWKPYAITFAAPETDPAARLTLGNLSTQLGSLQLAQISVRPAGYRGLPAGQTLDDATVFKRNADYALRTPGARGDWAQFLLDTENAYWTEMRSHLQSTIGTRAILIGSQLLFSPLAAQQAFEVVSDNAYWSHPTFLSGATFTSTDWVMPNLSMAADPGASPLRRLATERVQGRPFIVTEYGHPSPNTYSSEGLPLAAAYGALQDWDALFAFSCTGASAEGAGAITGFFDNCRHPTKAITLPQAALMFRRGDVRPASNAAFASVGQGNLLAHLTRNLAGAALYVTADEVDVDPLAAFSGQVGVTLGAEAPATPGALPPTVPAQDRTMRANGGELVWTTRANATGQVVIDTAQSQGAIGSIVGQTLALGRFSVAATRNRQNWAAILLTRLPDDPARPGGQRWLLSATGDAANTGMQFKDASRESLVTWGTAPSLAEGIGATIGVAASTVEVWALDGAGQRSTRVAVTAGSGTYGTEFAIGPEFATVWYEVLID